MNIHTSSDCPIECAQYLDTVRVIKMITENAQMLSTALKGSHELLMKPTHANHPCTKWIGHSRQNAQWVVDYTVALFDEYKRRRNKTEHKSMRIIDLINKNNLLSVLPDAERTPFVNCAKSLNLGIDYSHVENTHLAYILYLQDRWNNDKREPTWS